MRHCISVAASLVLAAGLIVGVSPGASAATCEVTNPRTGTTYANPQRAVDRAALGDTLEVRGICVGETIISATRLRLRGVSTSGQPTPTLDGASLSRVLKIVNAKVVIRDITVTNGKARYGGGMWIRWLPDRPAAPRQPSWTILRGHTSITGNTGYAGGGVRNSSGTLVMNGSASITGNTATGIGGGVHSLEVAEGGGTVVLNDSASISGNTAGGDGGGIYTDLTFLVLDDATSISGNTAGGDGGGITNNGGNVHLNDSASISGNWATSNGGGILNVARGIVGLNDSASVTGNAAEGVGGGIYNDSARGAPRVYVCSDLVAISPNDPDDPPELLSCS